MIRILGGAVLAFAGIAYAARGVLGDSNLVAVLGGVAFVVGLLLVVSGVER